MNEQSKLSELKGVGPKTEALFHKLGLNTIDDLMHFYPRNYDVYEKPVSIGEIEEGRTQAVFGVIYGRVQISGNQKLSVTTLCLKDITGILKVIWFRMPFLKHTLKSGQAVILRGRIVRRKGVCVMEHPEIFLPPTDYDKKCDTLQPIYPLVKGLTNHTLTKALAQGMEYIDLHGELLPDSLRQTYHLITYRAAIQGIHFPKDKEEFYTARKRLVFEEFLIFILALQYMKKQNNKVHNNFDLRSSKALSAIQDFQNALPYELTKAQKQVWEDIKKDLCGPFVMSRLIQGDVGSGKTIVAILALMLIGLHGYQGAMMAPTEVLAKQHYLSIIELFTAHKIPLQVELLTGSMSVKEKKEATKRIYNGEVQIIIGTHALIQEKVIYHNLALVITDEQHRFGVKQREQLAQKGKMPHILVMSATPIPRTLAIILYGDLDISVMNELPANRLPIKNCVVDINYRKTAYQFMKKKIEEGRQCYVICPMVEESEFLEAENVMDYAKTLQDEFGSTVSVAYLHGKMNQSEKDEIMTLFSNNQIQVIVSTTVIEVGINVPNAVVMFIENAERFGLSQLHQLRGRVGRGIHQSYCIFMSNSKSKETKQRLEILNHSNDGFFIASEDLRLRGPGDLFGIRQSGLLQFRLGDVFQDAKILQQANEAANAI
ncbi:MAG: ATP-dependent DNA helicase RecG, partial [Lachnospiraceae bacterium]